MPLTPGSSRETISHNIEEMQDAGHPHRQAVAAALETARKTRETGGRLIRKHTKAEVHYSDGMKDSRCKNCVHYEGNRRCEEVLGWIDPMKWCKLFHMKRAQRAEGGRVKLHVGPIHSAVAGRTDHLPIHVPKDSYVLPADIVSGMGEGNTLAGFKIAKKLPYSMFDVFNRTKGSPYGQKGLPYRSSLMPYAQGDMPYGVSAVHGAGGSHKGLHAHAIPIVAAGGEHVYSPHEAWLAGGGDTDHGHRNLDEFVKQYREHLVDKLSSLPGPKRD